MFKKNFYLIFLFLLLQNFVFAQENAKKIYLIPGQGSDYRLFQKLTLNHDTVYIHHFEPVKNETMAHYAQGFINQIDTSGAFSLIGVSLGGMIAVELSKIISPEEIIIISSAKTYKELPFRYKFWRAFPLNKILGKRFMRRMGIWLQPILEPDSKNNREVFKSMISGKSATFIKRTSNMIINWKNTEYPDNLTHIHGDKDHTIPARNVTDFILISGGSHMMTLTRASEISDIINEIIK